MEFKEDGMDKELKAGGYYALERRGRALVRVLVVEDGVVHYAVCGVSLLPDGGPKVQQRVVQTITAHPDKLRGTHIPVVQEVFMAQQPNEICVLPILEVDLEGYRVWQADPHAGAFSDEFIFSG